MSDKKLLATLLRYAPTKELASQIASMSKEVALEVTPLVGYTKEFTLDRILQFPTQAAYFCENSDDAVMLKEIIERTSSLDVLRAVTKNTSVPSEVTTAASVKLTYLSPPPVVLAPRSVEQAREELFRIITSDPTPAPKRQRHMFELLATLPQGEQVSILDSLWETSKTAQNWWLVTAVLSAHFHKTVSVLVSWCPDPGRLFDAVPLDVSTDLLMAWLISESRHGHCTPLSSSLLEELMEYASMAHYNDLTAMAEKTRHIWVDKGAVPYILTHPKWAVLLKGAVLSTSQFAQALAIVQSPSLLLDIALASENPIVCAKMLFDNFLGDYVSLEVLTRLAGLATLEDPELVRSLASHLDDSSGAAMLLAEVRSPSGALIPPLDVADFLCNKLPTSALTSSALTSFDQAYASGEVPQYYGEHVALNLPRAFELFSGLGDSALCAYLVKSLLDHASPDLVVTQLSSGAMSSPATIIKVVRRLTEGIN